MIPKCIHQIWFQGAERVPQRYKDNVSLLKSMNPGWNHIVWDEGSLRKECSKLGADVLARFDSCEYMHQKIDLGRYVVVYANGGISIDMDVKALQPLDSWKCLPKINRLAVSRASLNRIESLVTTGFKSMTLINNAVVMAPPRSPALRHIISYVCNRLSSLHERSKVLSKEIMVTSTTGPEAFTMALHQLPRSSFIELPFKYFEPCAGQDTSCIPTHEALIFHQQDWTWMNKNIKNATRVYYICKRECYTIALCVLIAWFLWHYK
jgi:mannosyltransferase OCH1-like enzyme